MVAAVNRVDEICQMLNELNPEEALQFSEVFEAHMRQRTTKYVHLFVGQALSAMTSRETAGNRRVKALKFLSVLTKYPSQWDAQLDRSRAILDNDDVNYFEYDEAGSLLKEVLLASHQAMIRDLPK